MMQMRVDVFISVLIVCLVSASCQTAGKCPRNEVYKKCGTACPRTCRNYATQAACIDLCVEGCFCRDCYVRNDDGKCVRPQQCPRNLCPKNEEYQECGTACPRTCGNYGYQIKCTAECRKGCFCKEGFIRNDDGKCVKPEDCVPGICPKGLEYSTCGSRCSGSCRYLSGEIVCPAVCEEGCFCPSGLVFNDNGKCVRPEECPKY